MNNENEPKDADNPGTEPLEQIAAPSLREATSANVINGLYKIYPAVNEAMIIDMKLAAGPREDHKVVLYPSDSTAAESTWKVYNIRIGSRSPVLLILNARNNKALGMSPFFASGADTKDVFASPVDWRSSQFWVPLDAGSNFVYLVNQQNGDVLDVDSGGTSQGTKIIAYPKKNTNNQRFKLSYLSSLSPFSD